MVSSMHAAVDDDTRELRRVRQAPRQSCSTTRYPRRGAIRPPRVSLPCVESSRGGASMSLLEKHDGSK